MRRAEKLLIAGDSVPPRVPKRAADTTPWHGATVVFVLGLLACLMPAAPVGAATSAFAAKEMIRSARAVEMAPGETLQFTIGFKNAGTATWTREGKDFASVYAFDPKYRKSPFADHSWMSGVQPGRLKDDSAKPGQIGTFTFALFAPLEEGTYHETFQLAAEGLAWMDGGKFTVDITVKRKAKVRAVGDSTLTYAPGYKALKMLVSDRQLNLDAGTTKEFRVGFKNVGRTSWTKSGSAPLALKAITPDPQAFRDASWTNNVVTTLPENEIKPGQLVFLSFKLSAPRGGGTFTPKFYLTAGDDLVDGGELEIPIEVRQGIAPSSVAGSRASDFALAGARGPVIRIGLFASSAPVVLAADGTYRLIDGDERPIRTLSGETSVAFDFSTLTYTVTNGSFVFRSDKHVTLSPEDPASTIFQITSYENRPSWDPNVNFNRFRGDIRVNYIRATKKLWVVEELPVEDYLRGLAETSNASPYEFQKALVTAARTYALFVVSLGGKHQSEFFDLGADGGDQVYKGYASELVRPNVVRAAEETRGTVVTYGGDIVVTPYFSRSDGRTRSWTEVWSRTPHPWLVSKPAPYDAGKTLWGHGVGMSASDAVGRADDGGSWTEILKYYYTGIELRRQY
ncbi:MAG: hypothetical protein RL272_289 [Candidatus Parcubacteria bacterium]|jgi:hypothetical protein